LPAVPCAPSPARRTSEVNARGHRWADEAITDPARKHGLALDLARLDELHEVFYERALEGDVACGALVTKIIDRRCVMFGLHTLQQAVLQDVKQVDSIINEPTEATSRMATPER